MCVQELRKGNHENVDPADESFATKRRRRRRALACDSGAATAVPSLCLA